MADVDLIDELQPLDGSIVSADDQLAASTQGHSDSDASLIVEPGPTPLGQTIAWDYENNAYIGDGSGPAMIRGEAALKQWIVQCLHTHEGAHPIYPEGYGLERPITDFMSHTQADVPIGELEQIIRDALVFHPAISDVLDFEAIWTDDLATATGGLELSFLVVRDDDTTMEVNTTIGTGEVLEGIAT